MANYLFDEETLFFDDLKSHQRGLTDPIQRIGSVVDQVSTLPGAIPEAQDAEPGLRIGRTLLFGSDHQDISYLEGYVQGKNIKNLVQFFKMNIPAVRANNCQYYKSQKLSGEIDHTLSITRDISLGQNDNVNRQFLYNPYNDKLSAAFIPAKQIEMSCAAGKPFTHFIGGLAYPIVTDGVVNYLNYNDPDAVGTSFNGGYFRDGILEPLGIRNTYAHANTALTNILVTGTKGSFMPYHQEQGDWSDSKGSSPLSDIIEFRQGSYDWFEDSQDMAMPENVFALRRVGLENQTNKDNMLALFGYVSDGIYVSSPFKDEDVDSKYFDNKYRQLDEAAATNLLKNSSKTLSNIGSRFKSANSGFIMTPKYDSTNQSFFGTDSVAFSGLLRS